MDFKKITFSDQLSFSRRKFVSGYGLCLVVFFIALSVVLFNFSFKAPFLNSVFQGFSSSGSHNSSILSWPFSFPKGNATVSSSLGCANSSNTTETSEKLQHPSLVLNQTLDANVSGTGKDPNFSNGNETWAVLGNTHVAKLDSSVNNRNFGGEDGSVQDITSVGYGSQIDKNGSFISANGTGMVLGKVGNGNFSKTTQNGSVVIEGDMVRSEAIQKSGGEQNTTEKSNLTSNDVRNQVPEDGKIGDAFVPTDRRNNSMSSFNNSQLVMANRSSDVECDIFHGRWVRDDTKPYYPPGSCPYIDKDFDCYLNGRPDDGYVKWKWQPYGCSIPSLNATDFLERLRGQKLVFVGDSLNRNMWESLVCILRNSVHDKKRVYEISGRREFKKKGFYAFRFEDYNCSVDFVGTPFLVKELSHIGQNGSSERLRLDLMDQTTSMYHDADVIIFNTGHWWTHEKTSRGEDYYQEGNYVYPRLKVMEAYRKALSTWARWVDKNIDPGRTQVIFRGYSVTHFRGGRWNSGGQCHNETEPIMNDAYLAKYPSKMKVFEHVLEEMKTPVIYLNISRLTDYRKDAHPAIYRREYKPEEQLPNDHVEDCSHWCLPGVPDTWNELLYAALLRSQRGSWRN